MNDTEVLARCPVCRARLRDGAHCPRCGANLSLVVAVAERADELERAAMVQIAADELGEARRALLSARKFRRSLWSTTLLQFVEYQLTLARAPEVADAGMSDDNLTRKKPDHQGQGTALPLDMTMIDRYG